MFYRLPMYQRQGAKAFKKDLNNSIAFSEHLSHPERNYPSVHVAGTNGKGSTSHMIASVLQEAGYRVGLYTSPHLKDFRERIKVNGNLIPEDQVVRFIEQNKEFLEQQSLSFFELTVGMAFAHFSAEKVDIAVVEVGLGGRLDSTNIIVPLVSVITNIGLDHTQFLGETLPLIAYEKAGIIKPGIPVVVGEYNEETFPVFEDIANERNAKLHLADREEAALPQTDLAGSYQQKNLRTALKTIDILREKGYAISQEDLESGLRHVVRNTGLRGRYQVLRENPRVICDTAHNREGLELVLKQVLGENCSGFHFVLGVVNDKKLEDILTLFPKEAHYYFCRPDIPRGLEANLLRENAAKFGLAGNVYASVEEAYRSALQKAEKDELIYVGGSTFVVAEMPL
jgi:dihydrofolate synthase/folylpolyglutamate synthase